MQDARRGGSRTRAVKRGPLQGRFINRLHTQRPRGGAHGASPGTGAAPAPEAHGEVGGRHGEGEALAHLLDWRGGLRIEVPAQHGRHGAHLEQSEVAPWTQARPAPDGEEGRLLVRRGPALWTEARETPPSVAACRVGRSTGVPPGIRQPRTFSSAMGSKAMIGATGLWRMTSPQKASGNSRRSICSIVLMARAGASAPPASSRALAKCSGYLVKYWIVQASVFAVVSSPASRRVTVLANISESENPGSPSPDAARRASRKFPGVARLAGSASMSSLAVRIIPRTTGPSGLARLKPPDGAGLRNRRLPARAHGDPVYGPLAQRPFLESQVEPLEADLVEVTENGQARRARQVPEPPGRVHCFRHL